VKAKSFLGQLGQGVVAIRLGDEKNGPTRERQQHGSSDEYTRSVRMPFVEIKIIRLVFFCWLGQVERMLVNVKIALSQLAAEAEQRRPLSWFKW
jgi:hypothetical protein